MQTAIIVNGLNQNWQNFRIIHNGTVGCVLRTFLGIDLPLFLAKSVQEKIIVYAEKLILETDEIGCFKQNPSLPPNSKVEVIILVLEKSLPSKKRRPAVEIAGKAKISVDIVQSIIPEANWQDLI